MLTPSAQDGNGTWGRVKRTWPDTRFPKTISRTTRRTITAIPSLTNTTIERDQGALVRRAETTKAATEATSRRGRGVVVRAPPRGGADAGTDPRASAWPSSDRAGDVVVEVCPRAAGAVPVAGDPC